MKILNDLSKRDLLKLLAILTFSDGSISKNKKYLKSIKLTTSYYNDCQHDFFRFLCSKIFGKEPSRILYYIKNNKMMESKLYGKEYILKLLTLSPSYKTTANRVETKEDFLNSVQPSLKFILDSEDKIKKLALRVYFDFDGSISPSYKLKRKRDLKNGKIYERYQIQFECDLQIAETNPTVVKELMMLCEQIGLNTILKKDKRKWSGIDGIRISGIKSILDFIELGGPITDVKISAKSKRLKGVKKKTVCKGIKKILESDIPTSYYFNNYEDALKKKEELNDLLMSEIKNA